MVLFLQGRRVVRASDLATHFEITERTVYRDICALAEAGVPIVGEAGVGYSLMKGYQLPPVMFSADEATSLFVGGELVKHFTDASLQAPMSSALDKLRAVLPRDRQDHVENSSPAPLCAVAWSSCPGGRTAMAADRTTGSRPAPGVADDLPRGSNVRRKRSVMPSRLASFLWRRLVSGGLVPVAAGHPAFSRGSHPPPRTARRHVSPAGRFFAGGAHGDLSRPRRKSARARLVSRIRAGSRAA